MCPDNSLRDFGELFGDCRAFHSVCSKNVREKPRARKRERGRKKKEKRREKERKEEALAQQGSDYSVQQVQSRPGVSGTVIYVRVYTVDG